MKIYYEQFTGEIVAAIFDKDRMTAPEFTSSILSMDIDEIPENSKIAKRLIASMGKRDKNGLGKFFVAPPHLYERQDWVEMDGKIPVSMEV